MRLDQGWRRLSHQCIKYFDVLNRTDSLSGLLQYKSAESMLGSVDMGSLHRSQSIQAICDAINSYSHQRSLKYDTTDLGIKSSRTRHLSIQGFDYHLDDHPVVIEGCCNGSVGRDQSA